MLTSKNSASLLFNTLNGIDGSKTFMLQYFNNYMQDILAHMKLLKS